MNKNNGKKPYSGIAFLAFILLCIAALIWDISKGGQTEPYVLPEQPATAIASAGIPEPMAETEQQREETAEENADMTKPQDTAAYLASMRLERTAARDQELELLDNVIADTNSSPGVLQSAEERRIAISGEAAKEATAENMLKTKGYGDTVVMLSQEGATVIIDREIDNNDAAIIADAVDIACGCGFTNVIIVNRQVF